MLMTFDIGNSSTAVALFSNEKIVFRNRMTTPAALDEKLLAGLIKKRNLERIDRVIAATVVPRLARPIARSCQSLLGLRPAFVTCEMDLGFSLQIDDPRELGADRIAGCAGALSIARPPLLVIDSGTATTFDLVDSGPRYIGGCILPGLEISLRALAENTARLRRISFRIPATPVGKNTADHIRAGVYYGFLGTLQYLIREYVKRLGPRTTVITTGGLSRLFHGRVPGIDCHEPDLVFFGLRALARRNP